MIQSGEERQSKDFFYLLRSSEAREGTWDSIIAVIGDGAKTELAGVRKFSLLPLLSFRGERLRLEPVPYYSYYEEILWPKMSRYTLKEKQKSEIVHGMCSQQWGYHVY